MTITIFNSQSMLYTENSDTDAVQQEVDHAEAKTFEKLVQPDRASSEQKGQMARLSLADLFAKKELVDEHVFDSGVTKIEESALGTHVTTHVDADGDGEYDEHASSLFSKDGTLLNKRHKSDSHNEVQQFNSDGDLTLFQRGDDLDGDGKADRLIRYADSDGNGKADTLQIANRNDDGSVSFSEYTDFDEDGNMDLVVYKTSDEQGNLAVDGAEFLENGQLHNIADLDGVAIPGKGTGNHFIDALSSILPSKTEMGGGVTQMVSTGSSGLSVHTLINTDADTVPGEHHVSIFDNEHGLEAKFSRTDSTGDGVSDMMQYKEYDQAGNLVESVIGMDLDQDGYMDIGLKETFDANGNQTSEETLYSEHSIFAENDVQPSWDDLFGEGESSIMP